MGDAQTDFGVQHAVGIQAAFDEMKAKWATIESDGTAQYRILHNPDQVAGGRGSLPPWPGAIPQKPAADSTDQPALDAWTAYVQWIKNYIGSARVNSTIGGAWKATLPAMQAHATSQCPDASAYPIWKWNLAFQGKVS